jgi:hypothetical protein
VKPSKQTATRCTAGIAGGLASRLASGCTGGFARGCTGGLTTARHPAEQPRLSAGRDDRKQHGDHREEDSTLHGRNSL